MWSGLLANVPTGWALCDGSAGTPDLRDKFIYGWSAGVDPGGVGGSSSYTPAGSNSGTVVNSHAVHLHPWGTLAVAAHTVVATKQGTAAGNVVTTATHTVSGSTGNNAAVQAHTVGTEPVFAGTPATITPPYFKLAFIMRV
jgi:hypothetical protein